MPEAFTAPVTPVSDEGLRNLLATTWGITDANWSAFGSERDDTLKVSSAGQHFVLKVAHPADDPARLHRQLSLMSVVAKKNLPFSTQAPIPTLSGDVTAVVEGRLAHLLPFLPGTPIRQSPLEKEGLLAVGRAVWHLQSQMVDYPEPYDTTHPWALSSLSFAASKLDAVSDDTIRQGCERVINHTLTHTLPRLSALTHHPTHNDAHTDNVLMEGQRVVGVVDWGDSVSQPHVADLAVAASYARGYHPMWQEGDPWQAADTLREGYLAAGGPEDSSDLFAELVVARLVQRIVLNLAVAATASDGGVYARRNMVSSVRDANDLFVTRRDNVFPGLGREPLW